MNAWRTSYSSHLLTFNVLRYLRLLEFLLPPCPMECEVGGKVYVKILVHNFVHSILIRVGRCDGYLFNLYKSK